MLFSILAGLGAAIGWGIGDFGSKKVVDRMGALGALLPIQTMGLMSGVVLLAVMSESPLISPSSWPYLAGGGIIFALAGMMFYRALAVGSVSILVAVYGLCTAIPFFWELLYSGLVLTPLKMVAAAFLMTSGVLVSLDFSEIRRSGRSRLAGGIPQILVAVLCAGIALILLDQGVDREGWVRGFFYLQFFQWLFCFLVLYLFGRRSTFALPDGDRRWFFAAAGAYFVAFVSLNLGMEFGSVGIVSLVSSLAAGVTALTAWHALHERLHIGQYFGIALGILGLMLMAL